MFCQKMLGHLPLVKRKASKFTRKSLNLAPYSTSAMVPVLRATILLGSGGVSQRFPRGMLF